MARGFTLQDIACLNLEGSLPPASVAASIQSANGTNSNSNSNSNSNWREESWEEQQQFEFPPQQQSQLNPEKPRNSFSDQQQIMQHQRQDSSSDKIVDAVAGGGLLACGLSWIDKQREKRQREYLKLEAEKQLQKIGQAQRAAHRDSSTGCTPCNGGLTPNSSSDNVNRATSLVDSSSQSSSSSSNSNPDHDETIDGIADLPAHPSLTSANSGLSYADDPEMDNNTEGDSSSRRLGRSLGPKSSSFGTSDVSMSGGGASAMLSLSDIDGIEEPSPQQQPPKEEPIDGDNVAEVRVTKVEGDDASPYILSQTQMNEISKHVLPETIAYCRWRRLYGLGRDGDSFDGCLRIIGAEKRTLMVVRTTKGDIFGGYADAPWHSRHDSSTAKFYGSASSCLYSFSSTLTPLSKSAAPRDSPIHVYRWTGKNRYIQVCDVSNKMLAFGGGGDKGAFGLCLQEDFQRGTTGRCETFDNDPLCSGDERTFDIVDLEFWEFQTGVF